MVIIKAQNFSPGPEFFVKNRYKVDQRAEIEGLTFHDLRHAAINWRLQGHDYFRIMAATGHKTLKVFQWYHMVSKDELKAPAGENR